MHGKILHDFLFNLYDFADIIADKVETDDSRKGSYFLTLVYIEQIFDIYGRGLIAEAAEEANDPMIDVNTSRANAHKRIDQLRDRIRTLIENNDFDEVLKEAGVKMITEWHK